MSFELPIKITGLPDFSEGDEMFNIRWKSENIKYNNKDVYYSCSRTNKSI
jgi:hypothetical protein